MFSIPPSPALLSSWLSSALRYPSRNSSLHRGGLSRKDVSLTLKGCHSLTLRGCQSHVQRMSVSRWKDVSPTLEAYQSHVERMSVSR